MGILGYPFVMADGIYPSEEDANDDPKIPRSLYIRWLQLASLFPAMKYSTTPWTYDSEVVKIAQNMSSLHRKYVTDEIDNMKKEILSGSPIIRPIWWNDPLDSEALKIEDEFLIGDDILVAPVLCEGVTSRKVYFPDGLWSFENGEKFIEGNTWIEIPIRSHDIPIFTKKNVVGSLTIF
ncbi:hypothetical protein FSP39_020324 [Pinctada imbricata]|uniref:Glycosyl hydrolase family 31 C-terminal domain-containing protein n=1 Tax=Pinctada imbricata TaxID=66713 RepID=A0AA88YEA2_PINIB|nr:hypothetical protein FSP39_020324 [Pinctada imbricata]